MDYIEVQFIVHPVDPGREVIIALLAEAGYESFEETVDGLKAYIDKNRYQKEVVQEIVDNIAATINATFIAGPIETINWNEEWEKNYNPVVIDNRCAVIAPFHNSINEVDYEIVIEPKMSFGTAHHATTSLMISYLLELNPDGMQVMDMGCGTGVLAILARKMGAQRVVAIDNYIWAYENAMENALRNNCKDIRVIHGDSSSITGEDFDLFIANINRNVLLDEIPVYHKYIKPGGILLLSGFYDYDENLITAKACENNFVYQSAKTKENWVAAYYRKQLD
ncbi:MAG: 50S ribosomal protein L11 methyltransferase [Bacteroidales bacterium]|nr:50S ribosomal protein L11 methyltransferase [Bacteroidales bacterium]